MGGGGGGGGKKLVRHLRSGMVTDLTVSSTLTIAQQSGSRTKAGGSCTTNDTTEVTDLYVDIGP